MTRKARDVSGGPPTDTAGWLDILPSPALVLAPDGRVLRWNADAARLLGWGSAPQPRLGSIRSPWLMRLQGAVEVEGRGRALISRRRRNGTRCVVEMRASRYGDRDLLVLLRDCTRQLAGRRRRSEDEVHLRQFLDRLPEPVIIEQFGTIVYANPAAARYIGVAVGELQGELASRWIGSDIQRRVAAALQPESRENDFEVAIRTPDGCVKFADVAALALHYGGLPAVQLLLRDVTARREAEAGLRATHERLRLISDVIRDHALLMIDSDSHIMSWNDGAERLIGYTANEIDRVHIAVLLTSSPEEIAQLLASAAQDGRVELETQIRRRDSSTFPAHVTITALSETGDQLAGYGVIVRDLTERQQAEENLRRSEEQLRHSQKMDAVGRLASGIAHDFNNVLTAIQGHVQFLLEDLPGELPSREDAEEIKKAADRATELTRQLLTFARKQPSKPVSLNVNAAITEIEKLLRRLIRADVTLETQFGDVPNVLIDPGQLEQVIVNLVVNARDAIGQAGSITIKTSTMRLEEIYSARGLDLTPGEYVQIAVSDTGKGMSLETQRQVFEPFFTTKAEGTGLGLSTVYGIVKQAGGHISVYSELGKGTTFKVFLPVHGAAAQQPAPSQRTGTELGTVLLVEDDEAVRALARRTLEGKGYAVVEAADGEEALRIARTSEDIDVVVTDLTMPRLNGEELALRIRESQPDAGIVLMSGFSEMALVREGRIQESGYFLEKPFTPAALVDVVRAAMQHENGQSSTNST